MNKVRKRRSGASSLIASLSMREQLTESRDGVMTRSHRRENRSLDQRIDPEDRHFVPRTGGFSGASPEIRDLSCIVQPLAAGPNRPTAVREREITALCDNATTGPSGDASARKPWIREGISLPFPRRCAPGLCRKISPSQTEG